MNDSDGTSDTEGDADGSVLTVGVLLGTVDGNTEGMSVGIVLGDVDGKSVGEEDGDAVGTLHWQGSLGAAVAAVWISKHSLWVNSKFLPRASSSPH
jgi:hypothetical protein